MRLKTATVLIFVSLFTSIGFAKIDATLKGDDLKNAILQEAKTNQHNVGYTTARKDLMGQLYLDHQGSTYFITDVYCEAQFPSQGPGFLPSNDILNVEHTWPQSKFSGDKGDEKTDLHHLFPADPQMNDKRANFPFGVVVQQTETLKCPISQLGQNAQGETVFQPPVAHRGNVARAIFYFAVRYGQTIDKTQESVLKQWNHDDPVDELEMARNGEIEQLQGNRNPFIDQPELIDAVTISK